MTPSQSQSVLDRQINNLRNKWIEKQEEGFELIDNRDRPSKLKTLYQQILQLDDSIQKLVNKKAETLRDPDISLKRKLETEKYFQYLNAEWLPYIHGETNMSSQQSQSTLHANEEQPPANNVQQLAQNVGIPEFNQNHGNTSNPTTNTVTRTINQDTKNASETSSVKRRVAERMKEFEIEYERKLQIERAQFDRKKLELEMQMKELEMQHQLRQKERDLERQLQRTALEKDDLRFQSTKARDKSPFNWTPKGRDVSEWANSMNDTQTPIRPRARFDVSPERNKQRHYPWYPNSRERSVSVEGRDISPIAGRHYNTGHSSSSLPKLRLNNFDGNPLEWPEWSRMFIATVDKHTIPDSEKMSHLKTLLTGKAKSAISGMGYSGQFYSAAWNFLEKKFGRPHVIIDAQLESLRKANQVKPHDSTSLINFSVIVSNFVNVLKEYKHIGDLQSSSTLYMAVDKLPQVLKEKWWFYVDDKDEDWPDLIMFEKWLSRMAFVHEGFSAFKGERKEEDRRNANREKQFSKTSNFSASSNLQETKQTQSDHCPLADGTHKIWSCPSFKNMIVNDRYVAVRRERLCYECLGKGHAIKDCKVKVCGINGCTKNHNRLLHSENRMDEGSHAVNVSAATINQSNQVTSFLQIVPVSVQSGGNRLNTYAFLDSGSTVSFIDQSIKDQLQAKGTDVTLNIAGIHGTQDLRTEKVPITIKGLHSKVHSIEAFEHPSISLGNTTYD